MAFDFFTQPRGPNIDISLFPDAVNKGIAAGNAQKTVAQNVVSGIGAGIELYQQYQKTEDNALSLQVKQNQVDQIPVQNKIQESQALTQEANATIQQAKAREQIANEAVTTQEQAAVAQQKTAEAEVGAQEAQAQKQFNDIVKSTDATTFRKNFEAGQYNSLMSNDKTFDTAFKYALVDPTLDAAGRNRLSIAYKGHAIDSANAAAAAKQEQAYQTTYGQLTDPTSPLGTVTHDIAAKTGLDPDSALKQTRVEPAGKYKFDSNNNIIVRNGQEVTTDEKGQPLEISAAQKGTFDIIMPNPNGAPGGKRVVAGASKEYGAARTALGGLTRVRDGTYATVQKQLVAQGQQAVQDTSAGQQSTSTQTTREAPITFSSIAAAKLPYIASITDAPTLSKLNDKMGSYQTFLNAAATTPEARQDTSFYVDRNKQLEGIAKDITNHEFATDKTIQENYSPANIKARVNQLKLQQAYSGLDDIYIAKEPSLAASYATDITPEEVYYSDRGPIIVHNLQKASTEYMARVTKSATTPLRNVQSQQKQLQIFAVATSGNR